MRRTIYVALIGFFILAAQAGAQDSLGYIGKGFKVGLNVSGAAYYEGRSSTRTGYQAGAILSYRQNKLFTLQMEFIYISKGYEVRNTTITDDQGNTGQGDFGIILNYLELPVAGKITARLTPKYVLFFMGGGFLGYSVDSKARYLRGIPVDFDLSNANKVDAGALAGIGLDIKAGSGIFFLESRFESSFTHAIKNKSQKIQLLSFSAGYWW
jgi:Outer membrane protein beta-barrel domain